MAHLSSHHSKAGASPTSLSDAKKRERNPLLPEKAFIFPHLHSLAEIKTVLISL